MNKAAQELGRLKRGIKEKPSELKKVTSAENGKLGGRPKGSFKKKEIPAPVVFFNPDE